MVLLILTLCLIPGLSADKYSVRESAEAGLSLFGDWAVVDHSLRTTECPEAANRLKRVRTVLTIRECDRLAGKQYPRSYYDLHWMIDARDEGGARMMFDFLGLIPYELWDKLAHHADGAHVTREEERDTTRNALIAYVSRTGDWDTVRRILK